MVPSSGIPVVSQVDTVVGSVITLVAATALNTYCYTYNTTANESSIAIGKNARTVQQCEFSHAGALHFNHSLLNMQVETDDATANVPLTLDGLSRSTSTALGRSNRYILTSDGSYAGRLTINVKQTSTSNTAMFVRDILIDSSAGVSVLKKSEAIGTDYIEAGFGVSAPTIQVSNSELEILVTGVSATDIKWHAVCDISRIT